MPLVEGRKAALRFIMPVIYESVLNTAAGLLFSYLIGGISRSSLTTIAQCNQCVTLIVALAALINTGSCIICSRLTGAGQFAEASRTAEQAMLLTAVSSVSITALCLAFNRPLMGLLMPNAESEVISEGVTFFRLLILSLPFLMIINLIGGLFRAAGDGRSPFFISLLICGVQLLCSVLFMRVWRLEIVGAGLSYLFCRMFGCILACLLLKHGRAYVISLRKALKPNIAIFKRIFRIGIPAATESTVVQAGYLLANSMVIGLGTTQAAVFSVANTIMTFVSLPQGICSTIATTIIGHYIGAREYGLARRRGWLIWLSGLCATAVLGITVYALRYRLTPIYSADAEIQLLAADVMLYALLIMPPGISLNTIDPQLRVGGDVRYVMYVTSVAVWLVRLPLTYLFCYVLGFGAKGVFLANALSLLLRAVLNMARFLKGKYLHMNV